MSLSTRDLVIEAVMRMGGEPSIVAATSHLDRAPAHKAEQIAKSIMHAHAQGRKIATRPRRRVFSQDVRRKLLEAQNHRCGYCGCRMQSSNPNRADFATIEHADNIRDGGADTLDNIAMACTCCNSLRDALDMSPDAFIAWIVENPRQYMGMRKMRDHNMAARAHKFDGNFIPLYESE